MNAGTQIVFTKHARVRLQEAQITISKATWMLYHSEPEKPLHLSRFQEQKNENGAVKYWRNGSFVFVVKDAICKFTGNNIALVITVNNQVLKAPGYYPQDQYSRWQARRNHEISEAEKYNHDQEEI
jgi:hypothetical protein